MASRTGRPKPSPKLGKATISAPPSSPGSKLSGTNPGRITRRLAGTSASAPSISESQPLPPANTRVGGASSDEQDSMYARTSPGTFFRGSRVPRKAMKGASAARPSQARTSATSSALGRRNLPWSTPCGITLIRSASACTTRTSSSLVAMLGTSRASARRHENRVHWVKNRALTARCSVGSLKKVAS